MGSTGDSEQETIAFVTTSPYQVAFFLRSHLAALPSPLRPLIFTNLEDSYGDLVKDMDVQHVPIGRSPRITLNDLKAGRALAKEFRRSGTTTVVTLSPKAGFVGQLAARAAGVPVRAHIFTGQVWADMPPSPKRVLARTADAAIGRLATCLAADSKSQARFLEEERIARRGSKVEVPHPPGSIRGVDTDHFRPRPSERFSIRAQHGIPQDGHVFLQLGRLTRSKGVIELVEAFAGLRSAWTASQAGREPVLVLAGPDEEGLTPTLVDREGVIVLPFVAEPELLMAAADILVLASHREGFGTTIIEAAACAVPAIGTDIVGIRDAIEVDLTGWLVPPGDFAALHTTMKTTIEDPAENTRRGIAARLRAEDQFDSATVSSAYASFITRLHEGS